MHLGECIARHEEVRIQVVAAKGRIGQVSDLVGRLERPTQQITASSDMSRPWEDQTCKVTIGPRLETPQSASLDQFAAKLAESKSGFIVAKAGAGDHAKHDIGEAGTVAVAPFEAETDRLADDHRKQVEIRQKCR